MLRRSLGDLKREIQHGARTAASPSSRCRSRNRSGASPPSLTEPATIEAFLQALLVAIGDRGESRHRHAGPRRLHEPSQERAAKRRRPTSRTCSAISSCSRRSARAISARCARWRSRGSCRRSTTTRCSTFRAPRHARADHRRRPRRSRRLRPIARFRRSCATRCTIDPAPHRRGASDVLKDAARRAAYDKLLQTRVAAKARRRSSSA